MVSDEHIPWGLIWVSFDVLYELDDCLSHEVRLVNVIFVTNGGHFFLEGQRHSQAGLVWMFDHSGISPKSFLGNSCSSYVYLWVLNPNPSHSSLILFGIDMTDLWRRTKFLSLVEVSSVHHTRWPKTIPFTITNLLEYLFHFLLFGFGFLTHRWDTYRGTHRCRHPS